MTGFEELGALCCRRHRHRPEEKVLGRNLALTYSLNGWRMAAHLRRPASSERYCKGSNEGSAASETHPTLRKDGEEWGTRKI
jgi:hypothetical protein